MKKLLLIAGLALATTAPMHAQTTPTPTADAEAKIDSVGTVGAKAYGIAAGLALTGVIIGFIRKAKR